MITIRDLYSEMQNFNEPIKRKCGSTHFPIVLTLPSSVRAFKVSLRWPVLLLPLEVISNLKTKNKIK